MTRPTDSELRRYVDEQEIRNVYLRYCRGIDRMDLDLVRACYHPDALDEHGDFRGGVDEFLAFVASGLTRYERTMHFIGNILVEVTGDRARGEAYAIALHRLAPRGDRPARDHVVGFRYVDDFARRDGQWRISHRVCVFDWTRTDAVPAGWEFTDGFRRGRRDARDVVFSALLADVLPAGPTG